MIKIKFSSLIQLKLLILIFLNLNVYSINAQSLKEKNEIQERNWEAEKQRILELEKVFEAKRDDAKKNGMWIACENSIYSFNKGLVWWYREKKLGFPTEYSRKNSIISWKSNPGNFKHELHLDSLTFYSDGFGLVRTEKCKYASSNNPEN